ncbi:hypothetical protein FSP39_006292 [Pinctada imbricata]|uniref:NACHT domain-containing protein n=1 Tax=Pinctada imbricata TaxID=66713 RepID=A0AA88Y579_PINIB|nr:hypothetical protein FSP39_006292 [Pinctada imbricata]
MPTSGDKESAGLIGKIISGQIRPEDIPEVPPRVVRVFLSSVGEDTVTERNVILCHANTKLREYCRHKYGIEFELVDLDWGSEFTETLIDHNVPDFKLREIQRCQKLSAGPNFIAFIGQKYGVGRLQSSIPATEFDKLRMVLHNHKSRDTRKAPLLDQWYIRDDNSLHPICVLRDAKDVIPELQENDPAVKAEGKEKWYEMETDMRKLFQKAAELSYLEGLIDLETKNKYCLSMADTQLVHGTEEIQDPQNKCVLFLRNIVDLKNYIADTKAATFADIFFNDKTELHEIDQDKAHFLQNMTTRAHKIIGDENTSSFEVLWRYDDVISPELHQDYLNKLSNKFIDSVKNLIDQSVPSSIVEYKSELQEEVLSHWLRCKSMIGDFTARAEYDRMVNYIQSSECHPLLVYGVTGAGKSVLTSKIAAEMQDLIPGYTLTVLRYVGYTSRCADIRQILSSVCSQILTALQFQGDVTQLPHDFKELLKYFHWLLQNVPPQVTLVLLFDAMDLIRPDYNAHLMAWLPNLLGDNVKIIVTLESGDNPVYQRLFKDKRNNGALEVKPVQVTVAADLLDFGLSRYGRRLTDLQKAAFFDAFQKCSLPLYVNLCAEKAKYLRSCDNLTSQEIPTNCRDIINYMFSRLEERHGQIFFARAMAYLVASHTGLSDCEMNDLLSLDSPVMESVLKGANPKVRIMPIQKWLRLKDDIGNLFIQREADNVTVYNWKHEEFNRVIRERYMKDPSVSKQIHSLLADYFLGAMIPKRNDRISPFTFFCQGHDIPACHLVDNQPLTFQFEDGPQRFNKRKYDQVPRNLYSAERLDELNVRVLFNYEWLYNKIKALSLQHIMADFALNPSLEASLVEEALRVAEHVIEKDIDNMAAEISGHLLPYYRSLPNIRALVHQCDSAGLRECALVPNFPYLQVPGSSLQYSLTTPSLMDYFRLVNEDRTLLTKQMDSSYIHVYDLIVGEKKSSIFASNGALYITPNGRYFIIVDHVTEKTVKIHNSDTGAYIGQLIVLNHIDLKPKEKYRLGRVCLTNDRICAIVTTDVSYLCIANIETCQFLQIVGLDGRCEVCEISSNGQYVFCNSNEFLLVYDLYTLEHLSTFSIGYKPSSITFSRDGFRGYLCNNKEPKLMILHLNKGNVEMAYKSILESNMPEDTICNLKMSPNDDLVLVRGQVHLVVYSRFSEKVAVSFQKPSDVPENFKLPKSSYTDLKFTNAEFSRDGKFVIGTLFRNIYLWQLSTGNLMTTVQAPVGIIKELLVSRKRSQIITHMTGAKDLQVWNIDDAVNQMNMRDKLGTAIQDIKVTKSGEAAFVRCADGDEIGVIDMGSGSMIDLLCHESNVRDFAITPTGSFLLASLEPKRKDMAIRLWNMLERRVIREFGNAPGYCISPHENSYILFVSQKEMSLESPYFITMFKFSEGNVNEFTHPLALRYVLEKPFLTNNDKYLVVLTAQDHNNAGYDTPTICAFAMDDDMKVSYFTPESFKGTILIDTILDLKPCSENPYTVALMYQSRDLVDVNDNNPFNGIGGMRYGFLILDVCSGSVINICFPFLAPSVRLDKNLIFSTDYSFCLDAQSNIFDIREGCYTGQLPSPGTPPKLIALRNSVAVYFKNDIISAIRITDGRVIARCNVHANINTLKLCRDDRTIVVGCEDGSIASYVLIDPTTDDADNVLLQMGSRNEELVEFNGRTSRAWDKVENGGSAPQSRPTSAVSGPGDKLILKRVKPAPAIRPSSDTFMYVNARSQTCSQM